MLAIVGSPLFAPGSTPSAPGEAVGLAAGIATAAAAAGAEVQVIGKVGDDPAGDAVLLALARGGVGHVALLRDAGRATPLAAYAVRDADPADAAPVAAMLVESESAGADVEDETAAPPGSGLALEPADIALGLRYVRDFRVLVGTDPLDEPSAAVMAEAAAFAGAALVIVAPPGQGMVSGLGSAIVLEAPIGDPVGSFAALVGRFAAALDRGVEASQAFRDATAEGGWERSAS